ncbi:MAG: hypothetical protein U5L98_08225 [Halomonas sp.]|uniref:hypothetical protein n=1 Tax=Halomonas sp. TaxID=1486246 RepID=UPI002ACE22F2|nr:hypothetical protein [Halomonas sp.]MDZ7852615.1 hypothetical protein [Halomonas sp.]
MSEPGSGNGEDGKRTEKRLVEAAIEIIRTDGFSALGVNAIADRAASARCSYTATSATCLVSTAPSPIWIPCSPALRNRRWDASAGTPLADVVRHVILDLHAAVKETTSPSSFFIWELALPPDATTEAFSEAREEERDWSFTDRYRKVVAPQDQPETSTCTRYSPLSPGAVFYLTLRSDAVTEFNGINIGSEVGWEALTDAVAELLKA